MEHRAAQHYVILVACSDPGVVRQKHVTIANTGILAAVFQDPLNLHVLHPRVELQIRPKIDEVAPAGHDRGVEVEAERGDRRSRYANDSITVHLIDAPESVAYHLVGDWIEARCFACEELERRIDVQCPTGHVAVSPTIHLAAIYENAHVLVLPAAVDDPRSRM